MLTGGESSMIKLSLIILVLVIALSSIFGYFGFTSLEEGIMGYLQELPFGGEMFQLMDSVFKVNLSQGNVTTGSFFENILKLLMISMIFNLVMIGVRKIVKMSGSPRGGLLDKIVYNFNGYAWKLVALVTVTMAVSGSMSMLLDMMLEGLGVVWTYIIGFIGSIGIISLSVFIFQALAGISIGLSLCYILVNRLIKGMVNTFIVMLSSVAIYYAVMINSPETIVTTLILFIVCMGLLEFIFSNLLNIMVGSSNRSKFL